MMVQIFSIVVFVVLVSGMVAYISGPPKNTAAPFQSVQHIVTNVDGFELVQPSISPKVPSLFGVESAIWANYPYFVFRGETYERAGAGGVVIRRDVSHKPRYEVREEALDLDELNKRVLASNLFIADKENGEILGVRFLRDGQIVDGNGWIGEHAAKFVRHVLVPDDPIGGPLGTKPYPQHPSRIERLSYGVNNDKTQIAGCPSAFFIDRLPWNITLNAGDWRFLPQSPVKSAICFDNYVIVLSGVYSGQVFVDLLTREGSFLVQSEIKIPVSPDARFLKADYLLIDADQVSFDLFYDVLKNPDSLKHSPLSQGYKVHIKLPKDWQLNQKPKLSSGKPGM